eukprot:TRINITY_DN33387_c0_g1_i1.p1 TRINITY_DN33387_c0_g1~~TRINITY_DN33387_c0_g1_i1.p1  ORF type:complete len:1235 (-),score=180.33 TRINITY_DN33387_c0_g1_i1:186-3890(-)
MPLHTNDFDGPLGLDGLSKPEQPSWPDDQAHDEVDVPVCGVDEFVKRDLPGGRCRSVLTVCVYCPCAISCLWFVVTCGLVVLCAFSTSISIETNFDSFIKTDVRSAVEMDVYTEARLRTTADSERRLEGHHVWKHLVLYYERVGSSGGGLLGRNLLKKLGRFEKTLREGPEWKALCNKVDPLYTVWCMYGASWINYQLATRQLRAGAIQTDIVPTKLILDGQGVGPLPLVVATHMASLHSMIDFIVPKEMVPSDSANASDSANPDSLRTVFRFVFPVCESSSSSSDSSNPDAETDERNCRTADDINKDWKLFVQSVFLPALPEVLDESVCEDSDDDGFANVVQPCVRILTEGSDVFDIVVLESLKSDLALIGLSMLFVLVYLMIHTRSLFLSFAGLGVSFTAVPVAYATCALAGLTKFTFASFIAFFLIIGFGCDTILVYTDYWRDSADVYEQPLNRLAWTYRHGGGASLATAAATALSFFANLFSAVSALRRFGFFMGLCVSSSWVLLSLIFVPLLVFDERWSRFLRSTGYRNPCGVPCLPGRCSEHGDRSGDVKKESSRQRCFERLSAFIYRHRCMCFLLPIVGVLGGFFGLALPMLEISVDSPPLFPPDHAMSRVDRVSRTYKSVRDIFNDGYVAPRLEVKVCDVAAKDTESCDMLWCDALKYDTAAPQCACFRKTTPPCTGAAGSEYPNVHLTVAGVKVSELDAKRESMLRQHVMHHRPDAVPYMAVSQGVRLAFEDWPAMVQEDWSLGVSMNVDVIQAKMALGNGAEVAKDTCGWQDICFCNDYVCANLGEAGWEITTAVSWTPSQRRLTTWLTQGQAIVRVVFGIVMELEGSLLGSFDVKEAWGFQAGFDPTSPWAQRQLYEFCHDMPQELQVVGTFCWLDTFKKCLEEDGRFFPSLPRTFHEDVERCGGRESGYVWIRDGKVKGIRYSMQLKDTFEKSSPQDAQVLKAKWDEHMSSWNSKAEPSIRGARHASVFWIYATKNQELVRSVLNTFYVFLGVAFGIMLLFTGSVALSLLVAAASVLVLCGLGFFIVVVMGWSLGLLEGICLIYFMGYAVTYSLHVGHHYGAAHTLQLPAGDWKLSRSGVIRLSRVNFALTSIGGATLGSGVTTAGASFFLLFSRLTVFERLGGMCMVVTLVSVIFALIPLPAFLSIIGPRQPGAALWRKLYFSSYERDAVEAEAPKVVQEETSLQAPEQAPVQQEPVGPELIGVEVDGELYDVIDESNLYG